MAVAVTLAAPPEIVAGLPVIAALAPDAGGVKVTAPPFTGSPNALVTLRARGLVKSVLIGVDWPSPPVFASVKPCDSKAPISQAEPCGRATPR